SSNSGTSDTESDSEASSGSEDESESSESSEEKKDIKKEAQKECPKSEVKENKNEKSNLELLLELDEVASSLPTMTPTCGGFLSPPTGELEMLSDAMWCKVFPGAGDAITPVGPALVPAAQQEMIPRVMSRGLGATRRWSRAPHLYSHKMCAVELCFTNHTPDPVENIRVNKKV
ncbi:jg979, partial [Pararge aegeria aegeria]